MIMAIRCTIRSAVSAVAIAAASSVALADMGRAPVNGNGTYGSIEGGYLLQQSDDVIGHGVQTAPGVVDDVSVSADSGWFAGAMIGIANRDALIAGLPFHRLELYGIYGRTDDDAAHTAPPAAGILLKSVDGSALGVGFGNASTSTERRTIEGGLRFEYDEQNHPTWSHTWIVSPFIRNMDEETRTACSSACGSATRSGDVDTWMYGITLAFEPEQWITSNVALVGRVGVGLYGYDADGDYRSASAVVPAFNAQLSDGETGVGFRGQLGAGLKFKISEGANLETFAEADYFSDVGTAGLANNQATDATASSTSTTDLWELRAGARLTFAFSSAN